MKSARITLALAVLGVFVAWLASTSWDEQAAIVELAPKPQRAVSTASDSSDVTHSATTSASPLDTTVDAASTSDDSTRTAVISDEPPMPNAGVGRLVIRAGDATTNEPLRSFGVRLASDTRFADERSRDNSGEVELPLTADTYSIAVFAAGYETLELPRTRVTADATNELETVKLRGGVGRIMVDVLGVASIGRSVEVELIGAGRRPCELCGTADASGWERGTPCSSCGFARESSHVRLAVAPRCEFENLASGNYALRVNDDRGFVVCDARELVLRDGERARVEFDLSTRRYVELVCFDVDGRSLSEVWRQRLADTQVQDEESEIFSFENAFRMIPIALTFFDDARGQIATASLVPPAPAGLMSYGTACGAGRGGRRKDERTIVDRARHADDKLWPAPAAARFGESRIACEVDDNGFARVGPLPSSRLELHAAADYFAADTVVPEARATMQVTLRLQAAPVDRSAPPEFATFCAYESAGQR